MAQIIDNFTSDLFQQWFREHTAQDNAKRLGLPLVSNLSSAKHGLLIEGGVLPRTPYLGTCHCIVSVKESSHESGLVRKWLSNISSEDQDLLQLALLADAAAGMRQMDSVQLNTCAPQRHILWSMWTSEAGAWPRVRHRARSQMESKSRKTNF